MTLINNMSYDFKSVCYFDTDSIIMTTELPKDYIDSNELGKMKLENIYESGIFVGAKVYYLKGG